LSRFHAPRVTRGPVRWQLEEGRFPDMEYRVVFDLSAMGYDWRLPASGLIFVAFAAGVLLLRSWGMLKPSNRFDAVFPYLFGGFAVYWTLFAFGSTYGEYRSLRGAMASGQAQVVEGVVEDFVPMPPEGHALESFTVGGHHFAYSDYFETGAFNQTASHGGPIRAGLPVRVTFVGDDIVRLEVAQ
jgi:hypothetical protein